MSAVKARRASLLDGFFPHGLHRPAAPSLSIFLPHPLILGRGKRPISHEFVHSG